MSSDGYFDDVGLDAAALEQLDKIENAHFSPQKGLPRRLSARRDSGSDAFDSFNLDQSELEHLDECIEDAYQAGPALTQGSGHATRPANVVQPSSKYKPLPYTERQRTNSDARLFFGRQERKTKLWDHTEFARTGLKRGKSKGKWSLSSFLHRKHLVSYLSY
jgi:ATP-dependent DNA helicase MPH1